MSAAKRKPLTARGVKAMLARSGVSYSDLTIVDDPTVWRDLESGRTSTCVVISGPKESRMKAFHELFSRGLAVAPYPDKDEWSR